MTSPEKRSSEPLGDQPSSAEDSRASLTALQENVRHLVMNAILRENSKESFGRLNPDGSLLKMSQGSAQASLDGSLESSCMIFPRWGILSDGVVGELRMLEPAIEGSESSLLPTILGASTNPAAHGQSNGTFKWEINRRLSCSHHSDEYRAIEDRFQKRKRENHRETLGGGIQIAMLPTCTSRDHKGGTVERVENGNPKRALDCEMQVHGLKLQPAFAEWMMGFPEGWTALDASEMPSSRSKSTRSSKRSRILKRSNHKSRSSDDPGRKLELISLAYHQVPGPGFRLNEQTNNHE